MTCEDIDRIKNGIAQMGADKWTLGTTPMMPESNSDPSYAGDAHRFIAGAGRLIIELCKELQKRED